MPHPQLRRIAVIGAGPAGLDFTLRCVQSGFEVILEDVMPSRLHRARELHAAHVTTDPGAPSSARIDVSRPETKVGPHNPGALHLASTVEDAVRSADLAIDFVPDELESKLEIFSLLDRMAPPHTILLTPTTALSIADLASCTYRPERCFALQLPNSASAKLIHTRRSTPEIITTVEIFLRTLGFTVTLLEDQTADRQSSSSSS
ncbi:MAG TPA: 3-hydroxyacyl-CoA dehydrogenase NAD-binding domain-containing protein [Acidobacteriaceae bacterium]|jgi:3-hydroxybutyryl-CoA dehydrogenase|nr:3-hydroxyacyl-CoA dehydrogenase NAD-binding domain-containing protein [Acidobacteriaceae bacterium]